MNTIEQAMKIYEKKQRALLNKKYPIIDIPADGKSGMSGGAYCLCFVYSKYKGNFVLRGYMREVEEYLKKNYIIISAISLWVIVVKSKDNLAFWKKDVGIFDAIKREEKAEKKRSDNKRLPTVMSTR